MAGWAADRFGTKRLYLTAIFLFTLGSALCATATSIDMLIGFRVLQGLGGGMLMPLGMTIMTRAAGPHRMGRLMAILGVPMLLGPILGPILGGLLIQRASWHWIFLINVPLGAIALVYAWRVLAKDTPEPSESFDFLGMALMSPGPGAVPLRRLVATAGGRRLHRPAGVGLDARRGRARGRLRAALVPARAPAAGPAAVQEPQPGGLDHHHVHVRGGVLRRAVAGADLLPADPGRVHAPCRAAGRTPGPRRDDHDADRGSRSSTRCPLAASRPSASP